MIYVTINNDKQYALDVAHTVELFHGRGTYGNGSIDWDKPSIPLKNIALQTGHPDALVAYVDGRPMHLSRPIKNDCSIDFIDATSSVGQDVILQTGIFLLGYGFHQSNHNLHPIKGGIENDLIYYDFSNYLSEITSDVMETAESRIQAALNEQLEISPAIIPFYQARRELSDAGHEKLIHQIDSHDDGGPVPVYILRNYWELDHGPLLYDLTAIQSLTITSLQSLSNGVRIYGKLEVSN